MASSYEQIFSEHETKLKELFQKAFYKLGEEEASNQLRNRGALIRYSLPAPVIFPLFLERDRETKRVRETKLDYRLARYLIVVSTKKERNSLGSVLYYLEKDVGVGEQNNRAPVHSNIDKETIAKETGEGLMELLSAPEIVLQEILDERERQLELLKQRGQ